MKVQDVMTESVGFIGLDDDLTKAARIMWEMDCGVVPVLDAENGVVGMITDRDICIAAATRDRKTSQIKASEMIFREVVGCFADDDLKDVLRKMRKQKIKRLPVLDQNKELAGIVSLSDTLLKAKKRSVRKLVFSTLKAIAKPPPILLRETESPEIDNE